jgi:hypothetical protein
MKCWKCGADLPEPSWGKIPFRATCDACGAALHCCKNCRFYKPGLPNDCAVPGTDFIPDRTATNFCEEFKLLGLGPEKKKDPSEASRRLFGEEDKEPKKPEDPTDKFKRLFGDE